MTNWKTVLLCGAVLTWAGSANAQSTPGDSSAAADEGNVVADIIVTAQKRSERLQDVPIAVTAVRGEQLEALNVQSSLDLRIVAPSLNSVPSGGYVANTIRSVGSFGFAPGIESPVGLYMDGVYIAAPISTELRLNNIRSVEVLKGPQGTLFGRNATGGVIQINTVDPSFTPRGRFYVEYGNYETAAGSAYVSGPITDELAADLSVLARTQQKGFGRNRITGKDVGATDHDVYLRSKLLWKPGPNTTVTAIGHYWDGRDGQSYSVGVPGTLSGFIPGLVQPDLGYDRATDVDLIHSAWSAGGTLKIDHDFNGVRLSNIVSYRTGTGFVLDDVDSTPFAVGTVFASQRDRQITEELQLSSIGQARLTWTAGLYYFRLKTGYYDPSGIKFLLPPPGLSLDFTASQIAESYAGYAQASYAIFDDTNLTLGGRYTHETRKEVDASQILRMGPIEIPTVFPDRKFTANKFTYRISLDHRFSEDLMAYASFNSGFKSGGFSTGAPGAAPYRPENLDAYEVGFKSDLFDRRLRLNVAAYYYEYADMQVQQVGLISLDLTNAGSSRVYGAEADFTAILSDGLTLTGGFNWNDAKFERFPGCPISQPQGGVPVVSGSCDGNQIPFASKFTGSAALSYATRIWGGKLQLSGNVYYNDGIYFEANNVLFQPSYTKFGGTMRWTADNGISITLFGSNLTDRRTRIGAGTQISGNARTSWAEPRTYGVRLGYEF